MEPLEDPVALLGGDARAAVGHRDPGLAVAGTGADHHRLAARAVAERVVEQDPHDARDRVGVPAAPARGLGEDDLDRGRALPRAQLELGRDGADDLAELDLLGPQRHRGVEPREVEQLAGERGQAVELAARVGDLAQRVELVDLARADVLLEQLHRALEHRQRRAQLVRRRGHERAPRRLLAAQLLLHAGERAAEVADLVAAVVARHLHLRALLRDAQRRGPQPREPAQQGRGQPDRDQGGEPERDRGAGREARPDLADELGRLGQRPLRHQRADRVAARPVERGGHHHAVAVELGQRLPQPHRPQRHQLGARGLGDEGLAVVQPARRGVRAVARQRGAVHDQDPRVGLVVEVGRRRRELHPALVERVRAVEDRLEVAGPLADGVLEVLRALLAEPVLHRRQDHQRDGAERHGARGEQREQQPPAQAARQPPSHGSRKR